MIANNSNKAGKQANSTNTNTTGNGNTVCNNCGFGAAEQSTANLAKTNKISH